mgnify:CR=1 FL=1|jgi:hypothetical protein|tara:strand:+ start:4134 stop:4343 length:210 start_codon:yes stop_codon:yes gene_type:complete
MEDAELCCRIAIAKALVEWAEQKIIGEDELTPEGRAAIRPVILKMASDYISTVLRINPAYILGENKNDG